jgi:hypothetical protein
MEKPLKDGCEYILTALYDTDEDLDRIIHNDILQEAADIANARYCFIEAVSSRSTTPTGRGRQGDVRLTGISGYT